MNIDFGSFIYLDLIFILILSLFVYLWIYKKGLKDIILLTFNLYIVNVLISNMIVRGLGLGILQDNLANFLLYFIIIFIIIFNSPLRKNLVIYSQKTFINILFSISFIGLFMVTFTQFINLNNYLIYTFLQEKVFLSNDVKIIWYIIPLFSFVFLKSNKLKK